MRGWVIFKREISHHFLSPLTYAISGLFILLMGWIFFNLLLSFVSNVQQLPLHLRGQWDFINQVILKLFANIHFSFIFMVPILTMRSFSEEKKEETLDLYYLSKVPLYQIVLGKYLSLASVLLFLLILTFFFPLILWLNDVSEMNIIWTGYVGLTLNALSYLSLGIFASTLSQNQIISALLTFVILMFLWMLSWLGQLSSNYMLVQIFDYISITHHFESFVKGDISFSDLFYYLSVIFMGLFLTKKSLESRLWK